MLSHEAQHPRACLARSEEVSPNIEGYSTSAEPRFCMCLLALRPCVDMTNLLLWSVFPSALSA